LPLDTPVAGRDSGARLGIGGSLLGKLTPLRRQRAQTVLSHGIPSLFPVGSVTPFGSHIIIKQTPQKTRETTTNDGDQRSIDDQSKALMEVKFDEKCRSAHFVVPDF
jgi:hypothetical protein